MDILIVYGSQYGNTQRVAQAIGKALAPEHAVRVVQSAEARTLGGADVDLLIVGAPTQMRGLRLLTRSFLDGIEHRGFGPVPAATFDTRVGQTRPGSMASDVIARRLHAAGCRTIVPPESFLVADVEGPLAPGELDRAADWARSVADTAIALA